MSKSRNQKSKLLYLAKILREETDEEHALTLQELISRLESYEISADRKTLYTDLEELQLFGMDIISERRNRSVYYYLASREFELAELKLLVDSVQSAKFVTERKSRELIRKLESLVSVHEARQLHRQVLLSGRVKTMNESIYYSVDKLHAAIANNQQIRFQYFQWNVRKEPELRHGGKWYRVSPWALVWEDEYYYLLAYDPESDMLKHYRVDKMLRLQAVSAPREGEELYRQQDVARYSQRVFGMFRGEELTVTLLCENAMAGAIIDRFGKELPFIREDEEHFTVRVRVAASRQFLGWVISLGSGVKITAPESMTEAMRAEIRRLSEEYPEN